jgi:hypothetical protein
MAVLITVNAEEGPGAGAGAVLVSKDVAVLILSPRSSRSNHARKHVKRCKLLPIYAPRHLIRSRV